MKSNNERKNIIIFLFVTFFLSYVLELYIIFNGGIREFGVVSLIVLMWIPGVVSLVQRACNKNWSDIGLKLGSYKYYLLAIFVPVVGSFLSYFICSLLDLRVMKLISGVPLSKIAIQYVLILAIGLFSALGEELGWRGYLVPKIYKTGWKHPTLLVGMIWALWHLPLVAFGGYYSIDSPILILIAYSGGIIGFNYFICWLRIESGSMWVATVVHAVHNFFFQTFWLYLLFKTPGIHAKYWEVIGADAGVIPALIYAMVVIIGFWKFKFKINYEQINS